MVVLWIVSMLIIKKVKLYKILIKRELKYIDIAKRKKKKKYIYIYIYEVLQFPSTNKMKSKKETMRDKVRTENAEMRLIKWESLKWWERERERESNEWYPLWLWAKPPRRVK